MYLLPLLVSNLLQGSLDAPFNSLALNLGSSQSLGSNLVNFDRGILDFFKGINLNKQHVVSTTIIDDDGFKIIMNMQQYDPEQITVKVVNRQVIVRANQTKQDGNNTVSQQFVSRFLLPNRADVNQVTSTISSDGVLTITAPLMAEDERVINIKQTGQAVSSNSQNSQTDSLESAVSSNNQANALESADSSSSQASALESVDSSNSQQN